MQVPFLVSNSPSIVWLCWPTVDNLGNTMQPLLQTGKGELRVLAKLHVGVPLQDIYVM